MINLDICSYVNYKVYERLEYSYIDEENSIPGDIIYYGKQKSTQEYIINGGLLLQKIGEHLQDNNICGIVAYKGTWTRLTRRIVRDDLFRGADSKFTLGIWDGIRRGEKMYISPFKDRADITINSTHEYELAVLKKHLKKAVQCVPEGIARYDEVCTMMRNIELIDDLSDDFVPTDSLLREFIGGGAFTY